MAIALDHPADGKFQQLRARVAGEGNQGLAGADLGERRSHRSRHPRPKSNRRLREGIGGGGALDEFRIGKQRRTCEHNRGNIGTVVGKSEHHIMRHIGGAREALGKRAANERRGMIEEPGQNKPASSRSGSARSP